MAAGINFDFIDHQSIARANIKDGQLVVENANASYKVLVFPNMEAARWNNLEKATALTDAGGLVLSVGKLPAISDHAGADDPALNDLLAKAIPKSNRFAGAGEALEKIKAAFVHDVRGLNGTVRTLHRKIGPRDVYLTMDAKPGDVVEFRAKGAAELWDPWTGETSPLRVIKETATGTQVELPLEKYEAQVVVFDPGKKHSNPQQPRTVLSEVKTLPETDWQVAFPAHHGQPVGGLPLACYRAQPNDRCRSAPFPVDSGARAKDPAAQLRTPDAYAQSRRGTKL